MAITKNIVPLALIGLLAAALFLLNPTPARAAPCLVPAGCTGQESWASGVYPVGDTNLRLTGTTSPTVGWITATSSTASSTLPRLTLSTALNAFGDFLTDLTGSGIINTNGALTLDRTGAWTGTFDGQEGSWYLDRANHTGTQLSTTISDFIEAAQDAIGAMVDSTLVYTDGGPTLGRAAITGDVAVPGGSNTATLATVNSNVGSFTNANITVNAKGLITAAANGSGGSGGSGTVATSSSETQFRVPFWDSTSATPALLNGGDSTFSYNPTADRLTFSFGSTTAISATTICLVGDTCRTTWPSGGAGISALGPAGQTQTGATQLFATSSDTNIGLTITSSGDTHTFTSQWIGTLANARLTNSTISGKALGTSLDALTATNGSLTFSGSYDGSTARTVGLNVGNANAWTALQQFANASTTLFSSYGPSYFGATATTTIDAAGNVALPAAGTLTIPAMTSAILQTNGAGLVAEYAGTSCTNQFVRSLSALGIATCATVQNTDLANSTISGVALGSNLASLTNDATLNGSSYNGSAAISDWGLNLTNPNAWTGLQQFTQASTSIGSCYGPCYFGATATSSFSNAGVLTLSTPLAVGSGGTGANTFTNNRILTGNGTSAIVDEPNATFDGTALTITGTGSFSTSATSPIFYGGSAAGSTLSLRSTSGTGTSDAIIFGVGTNGGTEAGRFTTAGRLGLGTTTPLGKLNIASNSTLNLVLSDTSLTNTAFYLHSWGSTFSLGTTSPTGTTSPALWSINNVGTTTITSNRSATSTLFIDSSASGLGGRVIIEDVDGAGCTEISALNGVLAAQIVSCPP